MKENMRKTILWVGVWALSILAGAGVLPGKIQAAEGFDLLWTTTYGDVERDAASAVAACQDGGAVVAGYSRSWGQDETDFLVYKLDSAGKRIWQNVYGDFDGVSNAMAYGVTELRDGSLIVVGEKRIYSLLDEFNLTPSYRYNFWVLKLDGLGNTLWSKTFGGTDYDRANAVIEANDGGIVIAGHTQSFGAAYTPKAHAKKDLWIIKLDKDGNTVWDKLYGSEAGSDGATSLRQCRNGDLVVAGFTSGSVADGVGDYDAWLLRLTDKGQLIWQRTAGGPQFDQANAVIETAAGNIVMAGETSSWGKGNTDFYLVCYAADGSPLWSKTVGGPGFERARALAETPGHNIIVAGYTDSIGAGNKDAWLVKLAPNGAYLRDQTIGGASCDEAFDLALIKDRAYVVAGYTASTGAGGIDAWAFKLQDSGN